MGVRAPRLVSIGGRLVPLTIVAYAVIALLWQAWVAVPGEPHAQSDGAFVFWLIVTLLLIRGLIRGSAIAWTISLAFDALALAAVLFATSPDDVVVLALWIVAAAEVALLLAPATRAHVGVGRRRAQSVPA